MPSYEVIEENIEHVGEFKEQEVFHPKYTCSECGHVIQPSFVETTEMCGMCYQGNNRIGEYLSRIYPVTIYATSTLSDGGFSDEIDNIKEGAYTDEMAELLEWGIHNLDQLENYDLMVPTPRGSEDAKLNHMVKTGEKLSESVDIPFTNPLRKEESYPSQASVENGENRISNIEGKIESEEDIEQDSVIVIDDIATSGGTLHACAQALVEAGAEEVVGLVIGRTESLERLKDAQILTKANES